MLNRVSTLVKIGYGEELDNDLRSSFANSRSGFANSEIWVKPNPRNTKQEEYINEEDGILNRKGGKYLSNLNKRIKNLEMRL